MSDRSIRCTLAVLLALCFLPCQAEPANPAADTAAPKILPVHVRLKTSLGDIMLELDREHAPITVRNFLAYVRAGHYNNTIFHRVIPGFMIQTGGYDVNLEERETRDPIRNEANNGLTNARGTIAMARTSEIDSATSQFFINVVDNNHLNHTDLAFGYAVFGRVVAGMDVVQAIEMMPTHRVDVFENLPVTPVLLLSAEQIKE